MNALFCSPRLAACAFAVLFSSPSVTLAGEKNHSDFVAAALKHSREVAAQHHLVAQVNITTPEGRTLKFQYDLYPEVERIKVSEDVSYARKRGAAWLLSDDWGKTGEAVGAEEGLDYDTLVSFVHAPLNSVTETRDAAQGGSFMRLIHSSTKEGRERFVFEHSREQPKSGHVYPCFLFERFKDSEVPEALLCGFEGPLYTGDRILMVSVTYDYRLKHAGRTKVRLVSLNATGNREM
ncbi:hypothetical protein DES53_102587 [Roseimicrobium gellanilyticum]|uniref:Outer membrane lipoprotein-sorting protein n=1 Tax=Roseimicrobium gellanilyticum TaxID=748857 RepID=A0A366HRA5_9BACT|nr:hypothetical protein [Roseimicrobium gellanilyticum]RBP46201.1 hypothetical protein DES53_102587 [Roseimicrobium gellanilyticum]